ncbi:hypothetical protein CHU98_g5942 [Xylaria longipes]|nr:hypothetical protein CHU98_g5942 [Xylaria longipes]
MVPGTSELHIRIVQIIYGPGYASRGNSRGGESEVKRTLFKARDIGKNDLFEDVEAPSYEPLNDTADYQGNDVKAAGENGRLDSEKSHRDVQRLLASWNIGNADINGLDDGHTKDEGATSPERLQSGGAMQVVCIGLGRLGRS